MKKKVRSQLIVVDADVAQACGDSDRQPAPQVLRTLQAILSICHRVLVPPELDAEWAKHARHNRAFQRWRVQMAGRRKIIKRPLRELALTARQLARFAGNEGEEQQVRKDAHLVSTALEQDTPVISLDDRMRRFLVRCLPDMPRLAGITWVNPLHPEEEVILWLERGALAEPEHQLPARKSLS
jgi:hypothetical protein